MASFLCLVFVLVACLDGARAFAAEPLPCAPQTTVEPTASLTWDVDMPPDLTLTGFQLLRKVDDEPFAEYKNFGKNVRSFVDKDLTPGETYTYDVRTKAKGPDGVVLPLSTPSTHGEPPPCVTVVDVPTQLTAVPTALPQTIRLGWQTTAATRQVRIEQRPALASAYTLVVQTGGEYYYVEGVDKPACFRFRYVNVSPRVWAGDICVP